MQSERETIIALSKVIAEQDAKLDTQSQVAKSQQHEIDRLRKLVHSTASELDRAKLALPDVERVGHSINRAIAGLL